MKPHATFVRGEALLNRYSGRANPKWVLEGKPLRQVIEKIEGLPLAAPADGHARYRGLYFALKTQDSAATRYVCHDGLVRNLTEGTVFRDDRKVAEAVFKECHQHQVPGLLADAVTSPSDGPLRPIRGLESGGRMLGGLECPAAPVYTGAHGDWLTNESMNNCYNYANNECIKDDFGPSNPDNEPQFRDPASVRQGMELDELESHATFPRTAPVKGHFFVAVWRPSSGDYHCLRLDRDGTWSHKDGGAPVTNRNADGEPFGPDLRSVGFPFDSQLIAYFHSVPGTRRLLNALGT